MYCRLTFRVSCDIFIMPWLVAIIVGLVRPAPSIALYDPMTRERLLPSVTFATGELAV